MINFFRIRHNRLLLILIGLVIYTTQLATCFTDVCRYKHVLPMTVKLSNEFIIDGKIFTNSGSGVFVSPHYILTAAHVAKEVGATISVLHQQGNYKGQVIWINKFIDTALVYTPSLQGTPIKIGESSKLQVGEVIYSISSGLGMPEQFYVGYVSRPALPVCLIEETLNCIIANLGTAPGSSGGAVFNSSMELVGIVHAGTTKSEHINIILPIDALNWQIQAIIKIHKKVLENESNK